MKQEINSQIESEDAHDLFTYLPSEIILNILLRIPARTIMSCKRVCKAWRDMLETPEFVQSHLSNSVPGLAVYLEGKEQYRIIEFVDEHRLNIVFSFDLPFISDKYVVHSSANGLLFVCNRYEYPRDLFICNPINREYITLPSPLQRSSRPTIYDIDCNIYGFGVSKMSGQYKVVRINYHGVNDCQVYTVGSGSWRIIASDDQLGYEVHKEDTVGVFLNGNLHWLAHKGSSDLITCLDPVGVFLNGNLHWLAHKGSSDLISCLDLETERFSTFSPPPPPPHGSFCYRILTVLGDYLCACDTYVESWGVVTNIDIWLMKEYGDEKSWTKELNIHTGYGDGDQSPIKVFKDGDILMQWGSCKLLYFYSSKLETIREVDLFKDDRSCTTIYTPSFFPLKTFAMENVTSF